MGSSPFLGQVQTFGFNFPPRNWALCNGQLLSIQQNAALFSLLGTTYGGNGQTTFALPNFQSRVAVGAGTDPQGNNYVIGQVGGQESVTLLASNLPAHNHTFGCVNATATAGAPTGNVPAISAIGDNCYSNANSGGVMNNVIANAGGGQPHTNIQPYLAVSFCIALQGIFPSRN